MNRSATVATACSALLNRGADAAAAVLREHYPFTPAPVTKRRYSALDSTHVFVRDGFQDRYSGDRLVFQPVLRILSLMLPEAFPYHPNWRSDITHPAYYEISATIDHLVPVSRGGPDRPDNWVTTSMARNSAKMNWSLDQLGWTLHPPGDFTEWDGLVHWFLDMVQSEPALLRHSWLRPWHRAAREAVLAL